MIVMERCLCGADNVAVILDSYKMKMEFVLDK